MAFPTDNFLEENYSSSSFNSSVLFTEFVYRMYKQEDLLPEKYFMSSAEIERTWSIKSEVTEKIAIWKHFLNKSKEKNGEDMEEQGSAVRGLLLYSDLDNCSFLGWWRIWSVEDKSKAQQQVAANVQRTAFSCVKWKIFLQVSRHTVLVDLVRTKP